MTDARAPEAGVPQPPRDAQTALDAGTGSKDARAIEADAEVQPARRIAFAATGTQLFATGPNQGLQLTDANLAEDVDVIAVHQELYGVPWQALEAGSDPPVEWSDRMHELAQHAADAHKPVFLSITPLNGSRRSLAARTKITNGKIETEDNWAAACYDFGSASDAASKRDAYLRYVRTMVDWFKPHWLNFAVEINLFFENCPDAVAGLTDVANAAYVAAKAEDPKLIAFPSIQLDHLYGYVKDNCPDQTQRDACFTKELALIRPLDADRFGMSAYPYLQGLAVADLPPDWFTRAANLFGKPPVIAETGWLSTDLGAELNGACQTPVHGSEQEAANYFRFVLDAATSQQLELVTWWSDRDLLPAAVMGDCPCSLDANWCAVVNIFRQAGGSDAQGMFFGELLMKAFGTMGLRDYDGNEKSSLMTLWRNARKLPFAL